LSSNFSKHPQDFDACKMPWISPQCKHQTTENACMDSEINGRAKGGIARAEALSPDERRTIAAKGAAARWGFKAIRTGNFQKEFGIDIDCYVLDDPQKTAVISQRGMAQAIGFSRRGDRLTVFINSKTMANYIGRDLREKIEKPIIFQPSSAAAKNAISRNAHGYDAGVLIDVCNAIRAARKDGKLAAARYADMVRQAEIIVSASAKSGIRNLVYALAGYSPSVEEVIAAFKLYVQEEAKKYEPEFPSELYLQWHRLYQIPVPVRGKPPLFAYLTVRHVYEPLAQSQGKIYQLLKALRAKDSERRRYLFQFLTEIGARALRMHLGRVLEMSESSESRAEYEWKIQQRFGFQRELDFMFPSPSSASSPPSEQSPSDAS
jgi:hypothetical protein